MNRTEKLGVALIAISINLSIRYQLDAGLWIFTPFILGVGITLYVFGDNIEDLSRGW